MIALWVLSLWLSVEAQAAVLDGVPFVPQAPGYCGPAALACVMAYHGVAIDQATIARAVYHPKIRGALITDLEDFARKRGFDTRLKQGGLEDIKVGLDDRAPVIVLTDSGVWVFSRPHYLVVTGYTAQGFTAHTGTEANAVFTYRAFEKIWRRAGSTYLVISPH